MTDSDKTLRERLEEVSSGTEVDRIDFSDATIETEPLRTDTLSLSTDDFETILIEHNDTEYVVVERGDGIALERCDDDE